MKTQQLFLSNFIIVTIISKTYKHQANIEPGRSGKVAVYESKH